MLTANQKIQNGRYTVISETDQNGIGVNYKAYDNELQTKVLLKEIKANLQKLTTTTQIESAQNAFAEKAETLCTIKHKNLLQIKTHFSEVNVHYLIFDLHESISLDKLVSKNNKGVPFFEVIKWTDQILDALSLLHSKSPPIILGDIKPDNIILGNDKSVKLLTLNALQQSDFSDSKALESTLFESQNLLTYTPLEQLWEELDSASRNVILNNFDEQSQKILEQPADARSDLYSLGATLYYLLTAKTPVDSISRLIDLLDGNNDPLKKPHEINPGIPIEFSDFVMKSLEIKREDRFNSAVIMRQVMRTAATRIKEKQAKTVSKRKVKEVPKNPTKPIILQTKEPNKQVVGEQKNQLELMKKQLLEAEKKRKVAEKRAKEAERLLQKQEQLNAIVAKPAELISINEPKQHTALTEPVKKSVDEFNENAVAQKLNNTTTDKFDTNEKSTDYFSDLYEEPSSQAKGKGYVKYAAAAGVVLLLIGFGAWGFWSFYGADIMQADKNTIADETIPLVKPIESKEIKPPEVVADELVADSEAETPLETIDPDEIIENTESVGNSDSSEDIAPAQKTSVPNKPQPRAVSRQPRRPGKAIKRKSTPRVNKPAPPKPKPTKPQKKSVTLDDLIKGN